MCLKYVAWAYAQNIDLSSKKFLLVTLAEYANKKGLCWPSIKRLAHNIGVTERYIQKLIRQLEADGYITTTQRWRSNGGKSTLLFRLVDHGWTQNRPCKDVLCGNGEPGICPSGDPDDRFSHSDNDGPDNDFDPPPRGGGSISPTPDTSCPGGCPAEHHPEPQDANNDFFVSPKFATAEEPQDGRKNSQKEYNYTTPHAREKNSDFDLEKLRSRLIEACGEALADPARTPGLLVMTEVMRWLDNSWDLELDILPILQARSVCKPAGSILTWKYFTEAIADAVAERKAPLPQGRSPAKPSYRSRRPATTGRQAKPDAVDIPASPYDEPERLPDGTLPRPWDFHLLPTWKQEEIVYQENFDRFMKELREEKAARAAAKDEAETREEYV